LDDAQPDIDTSSFKTALVVDTNILLRQVDLSQLLRCADQNEFDSKYEVVTLDAVINEVKDEKSREYIKHRLLYELEVK
jgi:predicted nucleic acid-binding protein